MKFLKENLIFKRAIIQTICFIMLLSSLIIINKRKDYSASAEEISFAEKVLANLKSGQQITEQQRNESEQVVHFINSEMDSLANQYELYSGQKFYGKSIEGWAVAYVIGQNNLATYIDFNEDNGYMVVSSDLQLYSFEPYGDLQYLKNKEYIYFSEYSGFVYYDTTEKSLVPYESETVENEEVYNSIYAGQYREGDGYIYNISDYVADRYPDYQYVNSYSISNYEHISQYDTSIYTKSGATEGNCVMNAIYSVLNSWKMQGLCPNFPSSSSVVKYDPATMEPNHAQIIGEGWKENAWTISSKFAKRVNGDKAIDNVPQLYVSIRQNVYKYNFDYDLNNGMSHNHGVAAMYYTANDYSTSLKVTNYGDQFNLMEYAFSRNEAAQYLSIQNSSSYHNHSVACYGYRKYKYETGWWIFKSTNYAYFLLIDDGHSYAYYNSGDSIYYDPNGTSNSKEQIYIYDNINL